MNKVDWSNAKEDAECFIDGLFVKWVDGTKYEMMPINRCWIVSDIQWSIETYKIKRYKIEMRPDEWKKGGERMEQVSQNGNDGEHYAELDSSIDNTLAERGSRYGEFCDNARVSQEIKRVMKSGTNSNDLRDTQREALEVIAAKIARIVNGDADYIDNWHDIIGYAKLVEDELEGEK
mgnify:CR=1 FL=1|tara:strand:- start:8397 stop:8927 length:531 start_codon:yes stop_codon:yes gene_type:complete